MSGSSHPSASHYKNVLQKREAWYVYIDKANGEVSIISAEAFNNNIPVHWHVFPAYNSYAEAEKKMFRLKNNQQERTKILERF